MFYLTNPDVREADVFTRMPEKFRKPDVRTEWARANRGGMVTDSFLEGPVWDPAGYLFVTDIPHGRIFRISPSGDWDLVVEYDGEPNGMKRFAHASSSAHACSATAAAFAPTAARTAMPRAAAAS